MKTILIKTSVIVLFLALFVTYSSCEKDKKVCISVSNYEIIINNLYSDGHAVKLTAKSTIGGVTTSFTNFEADYSHSNITHHIVYSNIQFGTSSVTNVNISIEGTSYNYPADKCK